nr:BTAD domain-containing putative transcriptional regulator [Saccharothrix australiensis]
MGELAVHTDGRRLDLGPARQRCVLAALVMDVNHVVPVERLIERVWGVDAPARARPTLLTYLSRLRQTLAGVDAVELIRRSGGYLLTVEESAVDLYRFRALCDRAREAESAQAVRLLNEALDLWRGEPLSGLAGDWALAERDRLAQERLAARHDLVDARLRDGQGEELVVELAARSAEHPLDERVAAQYLLALYRGGRQADALAHYQRVRERLVEELGTDPGPALQELHRQVLAAAPALLAAPARTAAKRAVVPRQLPAAPASFVGRREQLDRLDAALRATSTSTVVISAIAGAGGVGKTWLALAWAHHHLDRFPDGQLFVDLHGFSPAGEPMAPEAAVHRFLDALGVEPGRIPPDPDAQAALYRSLVADKRVLVMLDNAATVEQVVPLLPGSPSCTVLVTSRNRLAGLLVRHAARPLHLDVLSDAESRALLVASLGETRMADEGPAVAELIGLCGGFPLALSMIAAHAAADPRVPLADTVAELREFGLDALDSADPTASLPVVLSWSLRRLTEQQRTAFALLGVAPGPDTTLPATAALTGLPPTVTRKALSALEEASLLERRPGGRYAMHDLVRAYAATTAHTLPEHVRHEALVRVTDFHLHTAHAADRLLNPHRPPARPDTPAPGVHPHPLSDAAAALAWLEAQHATLLATQRTAATLGRHHVVWHLAWALDTFHFRRGHRRDALATWRAALAAAEHLSDLTARSRAHRLFGNACARLGRYGEAAGHLDRALALARQHHGPIEQALTHYALTAAWERQGDDRRALEHARHALDLYRTLDLPVWEADALNAVGWLAARLGEFDTARDHCLAALALFRRHRYTDGEATTLDSLGFIAHRTGDHQQALDHYHQALTLYRALGNTYHVANTLDRLGQPHAALARTGQAQAVWREALALYRDQGRDDDADRVQKRLDDLAHTSPNESP